MKHFYLVENEDGVRFIPSIGLHYAIPCMILGEMSIDDDFDFSVFDLRNVNDLIRREHKSKTSSSLDDLCKFGIKESK